jgi:hypothetical protein
MAPSATTTRSLRAVLSEPVGFASWAGRLIVVIGVLF